MFDKNVQLAILLRTEGLKSPDEYNEIISTLQDKYSSKNIEHVSSEDVSTIQDSFKAAEKEYSDWDERIYSTYVSHHALNRYRNDIDLPQDKIPVLEKKQSDTHNQISKLRGLVGENFNNVLGAKYLIGISKLSGQEHIEWKSEYSHVHNLYFISPEYRVKFDIGMMPDMHIDEYVGKRDVKRIATINKNLEDAFALRQTYPL
jgi:hypothetical protein